MLSVNVVLNLPGAAPPAAQRFLTVVADEGSDVFTQMSGLENQELFIADNASFTDRLTFPNFDSQYDALYVFHGTVIDRQAFDPVAGFGMPVGYPWAAGDVEEADLTFVMPTEGIDFLELVQGSIDLNDGSNNDTLFFNNIDAAGNFGPTFFITDGPGVGGTLNYATGSTGGNRPQLTFTFDDDNLFGETVGETDVPRLSLDYDADAERPIAGNANIRRVTPSDLGAAVGAPHRIEMFDPQFHQYVPGSLSGTIDLVFGPSTRASIPFQVNTPGTGVVPVSFDAARDILGELGGFDWIRSNGASTNDAEFVAIEGSFDSVAGVLTVSAFTAIRNDQGNITLQELTPYSTFVSEATIALRDIDPTNSAEDLIGTLYDPAPNNFTLFPGQTFTRSLFVDLANPESRVTIESPIVTRDDTPWTGRVSLASTDVKVNSPIRADVSFVVPDVATSGFGTFTELLTVNSVIGSPVFDIRLADNPETATIGRTQLVVTQTGSLSDLDDVLDRTPATLPLSESVFVEVIDGNTYIEGRVVAELQSYLVSSPQMEEDPNSEVGGYPDFEPYRFTTSSRLTGLDTGRIEATTLAITLANDMIVLPPFPPQGPFMPSTAFSVLDITTQVARLRVQASDRVNDPLEQPFPYQLTVRENDDLFVDAVAASSLPIDISANGSLDLLSAIETAGDLRLSSSQLFVLGAPISSWFGVIDLEAPEMQVLNSVRVLDATQDEREIDVRLNATEGPLLINDAVSAINRVVVRQQGLGGITGSARILADVVEVESASSVDVATNANRVVVRAPGVVSVDELDYGIFEIRDAANVTLTANGFDQIVTADQVGVPGGNRAYTSPALYADVYDTQTLTVSAPNGSIDIYHYGDNPLALGDAARIGQGTATRMEAAGSVTIRSDLGAITVLDAPTPTGSAREVRVATTAPLNGTYLQNSPGAVPSRLQRVRITRLNEDGQSLPAGTVDATYKFAQELDGVDVTTLRLNDRILVKDGAGTPGQDDVGKRANGIYRIVGINYPIGDTSYCELDLVRTNDADTTADLAQKHYVRVTERRTLETPIWTADGSTDNANGDPIYAGWGDAGEYRFANIFDNDPGEVAVQVRPIAARTGFVTARAVAPAALLTGDLEAVYDHQTGTINGVGFTLPEFDGVMLNKDDLVLVREGARNGAGQVDKRSPGLYSVSRLGDGVSQAWGLERYQGRDDDGDGQLDAFFTGRVAIDEGTLRTQKTGLMYEIGLNSLGFSELRYDPVSLFTGGGEFDSVRQVRTNIGSNNPIAGMSFVVSTEAGANDDTGSLGRMLSLLQSNSAINERTGERQSQGIAFSETVSNIVLTQELPPIFTKTAVRTTRPVAIDGRQVLESWEGAPVRSGSVSTNIGPVRPAEATVARRLYRLGQDVGDDGRVHGLQFREGSDGSIVSGLTIGGFVNGSAILIKDAGNVLVDSVLLGQSQNGNGLRNGNGVEVQGSSKDNIKTVEHTTIRNATILNSAGSGILLGNETGRVHVVGSRVGLVGDGNTVGITLASTDVVPAYVGAAEGSFSSTVTANGTIDPVSRGDVLFGTETSGVSDIRVGMYLYDQFSLREVTNVAVDGRFEEPQYRVTLSGPELPVADTIRVQIGHLAESVSEDYTTDRPGKVRTGDMKLRLPETISEGDIFLGQEVSSAQNVFASGTFIEAIETRKEDGRVYITLSQPVARTEEALLRLGTPAANILAGNADGLVIDSYASRLVNTVVRDSVFDGIRIERTAPTAAEGQHVLGEAVPLPLDKTLISQGASRRNLQIFGNQLSGIRLTQNVFAALGDLVGTNTTPNVDDPAKSGDYATIDDFLEDNVRIRGNFIGYNSAGASEAGNGLTGVENIVIDIGIDDPGYDDRARINFLLLADETPRDDNGTPGDLTDDPVEARLRRNVLSGLDWQGNFYGFGGGEPPPPPGDRDPTSVRRPVVRG